MMITFPPTKTPSREAAAAEREPGRLPPAAPRASAAEPVVVTPPAAPVRGESCFVRVDRALAWFDGWLGRWLPAELNPLAQAGAAANLALIVAVATGVLLLIWYSPSVQFAYSSLQQIQGLTPGGWVRALHRYSSDLAMLLIVVHAGRVFFARKFGGARWLPWVSGVAMLALVWFIGWTGYWLVWDQPAQQVAVSSMRLLDGLPIFGEPLARLYVSDRTVPSLLFFVVFFLHMLLPLAIAVGLAFHLARVSRARLLPPRGLAWALVAGMAIAAALVPAPLGEPARMAKKAGGFTVDAWYLSPLALGLRFQEGGLWVALFGGTALAALVPWLLGRRRKPDTFQARVNVSRCHSCTQCVQDCPFDAITMVARTDGKNFPSQAQVDPARCVGCGVCAGSCDSEAIGLTWFDTRVQEARIEREIGDAISQTRPGWVAFVAAEIGGGFAHADRSRWQRELPGYSVHIVPTGSWVRSRLVERILAAGVQGVLVVRDAAAEAWARDGGRWVGRRLAGTRDPIFRPERAAGGAWCVIGFDPSRPAELARAAVAFRAEAAGGVRTRRASHLLARIFHGLLCRTVAGCALRSNIRARFKTAERFCFSPQMPGEKGKRCRSVLESCEICGLAGIAASVVIAGLMVAAVAPSHLSVRNPQPPHPEFVFSFKALGEMVPPPPLDPAAEAAKPVHMRGRTTQKPHRADVIVRVRIDGVMEERVFTPKGISGDGPAIGEWHRPMREGERAVAIEVITGPRVGPAKWQGTVRAEARKLSVISFEPRGGFVVE